MSQKIYSFIFILLIFSMGCAKNKVESISSSLSTPTQESANPQKDKGILTASLSTKVGTRYPAYYSVPIKIKYKGSEKCQLYIQDIGIRFVGSDKFVKRIKGPFIKKSWKSNTLNNEQEIEESIPIPIMLGASIESVIVGIEHCFDKAIIENKIKKNIYKRKKIQYIMQINRNDFSSYPKKQHTRSYNKNQKSISLKIQKYKETLITKLQGEWKGLSNQEIKNKARDLKKKIYQTK